MTRAIIASNLQRWMTERPELGTQPKVAEKSGVGQTTIGRILRQDVSATAENLAAIARAFGRTAGDLLSDRNVESTPLIAVRTIPLIGYVQAGMWTEATDAYSMGAGSEYLKTDLEDLGPNAFALRIKGDSNYPDFKEGDIVIIDPSVKPLPGDMVVAKNGHEEATFKKYRPRGIDETGQDVFELVPLNDDFPTLRSDRDGPMRIVGTMVEHRRFRRR